MLDSNTDECIVLDFETEAIEGRPKYPPRPVGLAVLKPGEKPYYYAWGHPSNNNCNRDMVFKVLHDIWDSERPLLFHNAKFDLEVARVHFGLRIPPWGWVHDTLYTLFLKDPHALSLSLKPAAEKILGMPPEERDAVRDWLVEKKIIRSNQSPGAYISQAPGDLVGKYAVGDVVRTLKLHQKLYPEILAAGMGPAYDRERRLMPILLENERQGMRVDVTRLSEDIVVYETALADTDIWLRKRLRDDRLNLDADFDVAEALRRCNVVSDFVKTKTGRDSTSKKNLVPAMFKDPTVANALGYRNRLQTVLANSMRPWLEMAQANKGFVFTEWNQVRQSHGNDGSKGTRTGRLSCSRFQNISKSFEDKNDGYSHPNHINVPKLPLVRVYLLPDPGHKFVHRDYNQQELRILAHFEDDKLHRAYNVDPNLDMHTYMQQVIKDVAGLELERRAVKILNFGQVYGMGYAKLAAGIGQSLEVAKKVKAAQRQSVPGLALLEKDLKQRAKNNEPIKTWGGRHYYCEAPIEWEGKLLNFDYKLLNYLIQGSAADCTKQAVIQYHEAKKDGRFLVTVHDEINISVPEDKVKSELKILKDAMSSVELDVPMISDAKVGPNWGELKKVED